MYLKCQGYALFLLTEILSPSIIFMLKLVFQMKKERLYCITDIATSYGLDQRKSALPENMKWSIGVKECWSVGPAKDEVF